MDARESRESDGESIGVNPLDALMADAVSNADPMLRERAYQKLLQRGHLIARRLMGDGVRNLTESMDICLSVMRDLSTRIEQKKVSFVNVQALIAYMRQAINSKVNEKVRYTNAEKRRTGTIRVGPDMGNGDVDPSTGHNDTESGVLERELRRVHTEIVAAEKQRLAPEHRLVVVMREQNPDWTWDQIATIANQAAKLSLPLTSEYCRQVFSRYTKAVRLALKELHLGPSS